MDKSRCAAAWTILLLMAVSGSSFVDRGVLGLVAQPIKLELGLSDTQLGLLGGLAFALFFAVASIPIARIAERRSRVAVITICLSLWSLMTALCGLAASFWQLFVLRMGVGVGEAGCSPATFSLLSDRYPQHRRATIISVVASGAAIGSMIGAFIAGWVAQSFGWRAAFVAVGVPGLLLALVLSATVREPTRGAFDPADTRKGEAPNIRMVLRTLLVKKAYWHAAAGFALVGFATNGIALFLSPFLVRQYGLNLSQIGLIIGVIQGLSAIFGTAGGGILTGRLGRMDQRWYGWAPALGLLVAAPAFILAFHQPSWPIAGALVLLGTICALFYLSPTFSLSQNMVPSRMRATAVAILMLGNNLLGTGGGPLFMGWTSDAFAARAFGADNYLAVCGPGEAAAVAQACSAASRVGLQSALSVCALFYLWAAFHYFLATRTLRRDLAADVIS
ncbi:MFS transporter [Novosphingobium sp.]|uniref:spinster family MFS transporter n=1 Tax=Novosphingobium sp. TaxID=1874826 RepID=UPI002B4691F9|nr:MFS transporter [Novosphingobium sp.]HKR92578.1 MFS transporter [Novosphingobium sp.]